jgi:hypothetical protein
MAFSRALQIDAVHHLEPLSGGAWRVTGSDPQFLVRGPFERGVWEWRFTAERTTEAPEPAVQIYYAPNGEFNESASVRFPPLPSHSGECRLRFWLPYTAAVLRFDPTDSPGVIRLGEITAQRFSRGGAMARAIVQQSRAHGPASLLPWLRRIGNASNGGPSAVRHAMLQFILDAGGEDPRDTIDATVAARAARYPSTPEPGLFSILTTVYDTPAGYLHELAESLRAQSWSDYEWVLLDNGSSDPGTARALTAIAADPRVKLTRVEQNLGIVGGMRAVLERAAGRYVLPVDSDDYLFPDALGVIAAVIQREHYPAVLYSDEDKLRDGRHVDAFHKPDWDPVLFRNCCYIAHLCAIRREDALKLGVYGDASAEGCHDWDTFLRFSRAGHAPMHVPEVVYSWRMHGGSTAANVAAKDYVINSQRHVLDRHLEATKISDRLEVVRSPLFPASPDWWIRRKRVEPVPAAFVITRDDEDASTAHLLPSVRDYPIVRVIDAHETPLFTALHFAASQAPLVVVADASVSPEDDEWVWEAAGIRDSFFDALIVAGRIADASGTIVEGPGAGLRIDDPGAFGTALKQRTTRVLSLRFAALDGAWLQTLDAATLAPLPRAALEAALVDAAASRGRVVATPFMTARTASRTQPQK